jgi:hypothetical protein
MAHTYSPNSHLLDGCDDDDKVVSWTVSGQVRQPEGRENNKDRVCGFLYWPPAPSTEY